MGQQVYTFDLIKSTWDGFDVITFDHLKLKYLVLAPRIVIDHQDSVLLLSFVVSQEEDLRVGHESVKLFRLTSCVNEGNKAPRLAEIQHKSPSLSPHNLGILIKVRFVALSQICDHNL